MGTSLVQEGLITEADRQALPGNASTERLDLEVMPQRCAALAAALARRWPQQDEAAQQAFASWRHSQRHWLEDHCRFIVLRQQQGGRPWWEWPGPLARRQPQALRQLDRDGAGALLEQALLQWQLQRQWQALRRRAHSCDLDPGGRPALLCGPRQQRRLVPPLAVFPGQGGWPGAAERRAARLLLSPRASCGARRCTAGPGI